MSGKSGYIYMLKRSLSINSTAKSVILMVTYISGDECQIYVICSV